MNTIKASDTNRIKEAQLEYWEMLHTHRNSARYDLTAEELKEIQRVAYDNIVRIAKEQGKDKATLGDGFFAGVLMAYRVGFGLGHRAAIEEQKQAARKKHKVEKAS